MELCTEKWRLSAKKFEGMVKLFIFELNPVGFIVKRVQ